MKQLKHIRITVSLVMLAECLIWVLCDMRMPSHAEAAKMAQIVPSMREFGS